MFTQKLDPRALSATVRRLYSYLQNCMANQRQILSGTSVVLGNKKSFRVSFSLSYFLSNYMVTSVLLSACNRATKREQLVFTDRF